jgi:hypothetical protein
LATVRVASIVSPMSNPMIARLGDSVPLTVQCAPLSKAM